MIIFRYVGYLLLMAALFAGGVELVRSLGSGEWYILSVGEVIAQWDRLIINNIQVGLERYVHPFLWDPVVLNIVLAPTWLVAGVPGLLLVLLIRHKRRSPSDWA